MKKAKLYAERAVRVETAVTKGTPDRVPFVPMVSGFFMLGYQTSFYDVMQDPRSMAYGFQQFMKDYEPDAVSLPLITWPHWRHCSLTSFTGPVGVWAPT